MGQQRPFKIIIVGGGIAGLTLANMLEKFDIDYILLEAHGEIAPPLGASIGLMPNGLLILDQLGCYEAVQKVADGTKIDITHTRSSDGKSLSSTEDLLGHTEQRHGYPILFFDRQWLLQVLYDQLQHKDRVMLNSRVDKIEQPGDCVRVHMSSGQVHAGDVVVGADGIHSTVRREMRRLGNLTRPGFFPHGEEDRVPCYYQCSFGIAQHVPGWDDGEQAVTTGHGQSFLVVPGPDHRVYWFFFSKLPEVKLGRDIPRYTKEDEAQFMKRFRHLRIKENLTFGEVYDKRLTSTLTPLHEVVFQKWFFGRIVLMGDSVHKPNPIGGQGGNGAIESAAEFLNALLSTRDHRPDGLQGLTDEEIESISHQMQQARDERAKSVVRDAHQQQGLFAYENPTLSTFIFRIAAPLSGTESMLIRTGAKFLGASRISKLPVPFRPRIIPYDQELPARPVKTALATKVRIALISLLSLAFILSVKQLSFPQDMRTGWRWIWSGNATFTDFVSSITSLSVYTTGISDRRSHMAIVYTLSQLASPLLIYTVEGYRLGNRSTLLALPSLFTSVVQAQGAGRTSILYAIVSCLQSFQYPTGRQVPLRMARALGPSIMLYYITTVMVVLLPASDTVGWKAFEAARQITTMLFPLWVVFSSLALRQPSSRVNGPKTHVKAEAGNESSKEVAPLKACYRTDDVAVLCSAYWYAILLQSASHIAIIAYCYFGLGMSLMKPFLSLRSLSFADREEAYITSKPERVFEQDMAFAALGFFGQTLYCAWNLRQYGYVTTRDTIKAVVLVIAGYFLVGPGATWAGIWIWRESVISNLSTYR